MPRRVAGREQTGASDPDRAIKETARSAKPGPCFRAFAAAKPDARPATLREKLFTRLAIFPRFEVDELRAKLSAAGFEGFQYRQKGAVLLFSARTAQGG